MPPRISRWMTPVLAEAARLDQPMPWERGLPRAASADRRAPRDEPASCESTGPEAN